MSRFLVLFRTALPPLRLAALRSRRSFRAYLFVASKAPWFTIADDLPQFQEYPAADS
jgi:hypothetical protein